MAYFPYATFEGCPKLTIYTSSTSYAWQYAAECDIPAVDIDAPVIRGDVDGSGKVDKTDSDILMYYFAGYPGYEEKIKNSQAADVDGDYAITRRDAMILARYIAGWPSADSYFDED